ncbi:MAG: glycosyltransferase family 2 protein [Patescibacteria group bacterium]|jgi:cellulose synthase/poly-beta-1,6-N-acetylglucosamine synthase-like glycosyltransferase
MSQPYGQYGRNRLWEILPGLFVWTVLLGSLGLSLFAPTIAIILIIIFDLYWMLRVFYFVIHVLAAYIECRRTEKVDWWKRVQEILHYDRVYHVIMLPTYQEELPIVEEAFESLLRERYRSDRLIVVLGGEERDAVNFKQSAKVIEQKYAGKFAELLFTIHPKDLPGEIPGKGSNLKHMAGVVRETIDRLKIPYDDIVVSAFDVDTVAHEQYLARLAYLYLTEEDPMRSSYQPVTVFSNNIWSAAAPVRIAAFGTTFWLLGELVRPERMWTFSSHSMPWRMLVDVGYWEPDLVSEDSRIFMQALLKYDGNYRVTPIFLPVSMDTVAGGTYLQSLVALYKQQRRWAWGVEHVPYMVAKFKEHPRLPLRVKFRYLFNHFEGMLTWSTAPFLIFALGYIPFLTVHDATSALVVNSPYTLEFMMRAATGGTFVTAAMSYFLLPPRPLATRRWRWVTMFLQWILLPISFIIFGALPALDAQTRLMLGKYLGFNVTQKSAASRQK